MTQISNTNNYNPLNFSVNYISTYLLNTLQQFAKNLVLARLKNIKFGRLKLIVINKKVEPINSALDSLQEDVFCFGDFSTDENASPPEVVKVLDLNFFLRLILFQTLGFGESFMNKEIEVN
ncbi:hypothetical protein HK099_002981, partial [Clydaea vesicula]